MKFHQTRNSGIGFMTTQLSLFNQYKNDISRKLDHIETNNHDVHVAAVNWRSEDDQSFYQFSFKNRITAELEYELLKGIVNDPKVKEQRERIILYVNTLAEYLYKDARLAGNTAEMKKFVTFSESANIEAEAWDPLKKFQQDCVDLLSTLQHVTKIINWLSFLNLYRLIGNFSRFSWSSFWNVAAIYHFIDEQDRLFGQTINRSVLDNASDAFNFLSVFVFAARLIAHLSMIFKHAFLRTEAEQGISPFELACYELYIRIANVLNDTVWFTVNLLTNYPGLWGISAALANTITSITLLFDLSWLFCQWYLKECELAAKYHEFKHLSEFEPEREVNADDLVIHQAELLALEDKQLYVRALYLFQIGACFSIIGGYLSVITVASVAATPIAFLGCVIGFGMYAGSEDFAAYIKASYGHALKSNAEIQVARSKVITTITKATLVPVLLVGAFTINFPTALVATVLYFMIDRYGPDCKPKVLLEETATEAEQESLLLTPY